MRQAYTIQELTEEFGVTTRTLRFYEDQKLITPERRGRKRLYAPRDRVRLKLILRGKRLGFSLLEIAEIIDMYEAKPGEAGQLELLISKIELRREELLAKRQDLDLILNELAAVEGGCRQRLEEMGQKEMRLVDE